MIDPEKKKEYNKNYYANNKEEIAKKLYEKKKCPICHKLVNHQYLTKHMKRAICAKNEHYYVISDEELESLKHTLIDKYIN